MHTMKYTLIIITALLFTGCRKEAQETHQNGNFTVEYLFEQNGCKMYRFRDGGRMVYWSDCQGKTQHETTVSTGKSSYTEHEETITSR